VWKAKPKLIALSYTWSNQTDEQNPSHQEYDLINHHIHVIKNSSPFSKTSTKSSSDSSFKKHRSSFDAFPAAFAKASPY
jgi:hypothetical protein